MIVSPRRFDKIVGEALDALPDELVELLDNIVVVTEDEPTAAQRDGHDEILGLFEGAGSSPKSPWGLPRSPIGFRYLAEPISIPDRVTLFRKPLCAMSATEDELFTNVYETLVHEFAHHFGIDDDRLDELGWG